ncbi:MAG: HEPN domain-containing protein [Sedimentisphaerales bacterium]
MNKHERSVPEKIKEWISFAEDDIRMADVAMKLKSNVPCRIIAFHAQQCAEKYLKAYLVSQEVDFPYTHSIATLLKLCGKYALRIKEIQDADLLTPYAITARYPGQDERVTKGETLKAIGMAKKVRQTVRDALQQFGIDLT